MAAELRTRDEIGALRERQATIEATLLHKVSDIQSDVQDVKQLLLRQPQQPQETAAALALHNAADAFRNMSTRPTSSSNMLLVIFAIAGAVAIGFIAARFITGH